MAVVHTESEKESSSKYVKKTTIRLKIKCRIEEFEPLMESTEAGEGKLYSEGVSSELVPRAIWKLQVHPNGWKKGNIGGFLNLTGPMKDNKETLGASYQLYFIDGTGGRIDIDGDGSGIHEFGEMEGYGWGEYVSHDRVKKALHADGSLVVAADIDFFAPDDGALQCDADLQQWPTKFSEFHGDQASSDCTIKLLQIGGMSIPAHKSILAAQSPIFRSMFSHPESEEYQSGVVKVTDFEEPEPMRALVRYCYMGQLDTETMDGQRAVEIFKLADRYCIAGLKALLEQHFVSKTLNVENVVAMAVFADTYTAPKLKEACIELIAEEGDAIFESADWKELEEARPKLALNLAIAAYREK